MIESRQSPQKMTKKRKNDNEKKHKKGSERTTKIIFKKSPKKAKERVIKK